MIRLLGPVAVVDADGSDLLPGGARLRGLLARLALDAGRAVDVDTLVDALWGADPPETANALQSLVSRLRRALGGPRVRAAAGGYVLDVEPGEVDALRFDALRREAGAAGGDAHASTLLRQALGLWHGPALGGIRGVPFAEPAATRLAEARAGAAEELATRGAGAGDPAAGRDELRAVLDEHPLRETTAVALARSLHAGGHRVDALAVLDGTRARLAAELGVDPGPELRRARTDLLHDAPSAPPGAAVSRVPGTRSRTETPTREPVRPRPAALTSFVGRDDDLARLRALTATARLITVTGPGGAGKTRLALEAVRDRAGPVALAELAPLTGSDQVAPLVLHAVGGPELAVTERDGPGVLARLRTVLLGRELVLLLDNCEHVIGAAAELAHELLTAVPDLVVLATSREPLGVPGEVLHPLGALDDGPAMRLFAERAAAVRPGFVLDGREDAVREVCRRLDGQPLPIELAAARVRTLEPSEIAGRLADRFRLLVGGARTVLPRHQTLRAVVDWSWELLSEPERRVATRFGVFAGAVDAATVEAVCGDDAFDRLEALVEKSLVVAVPDDAGGPTRYRMLETIREYAAARLADSGEHDAVVAAHAAQVLAVLEPVEPRLRAADQLDALAVVRGVEEEATRALERATGAGNVAVAHRLLAALAWSWIVRGNMAALRTWSARVAEAGPPPGGMAAAVNRALRAVLLAAEPDPQAGPGSSAPEERGPVESGADPASPGPQHPVVALHGPTVRAFADGDRSALCELAAGDGETWLRAAAAHVAAVHAENAGDIDVQRDCLRTAHELFSAVGDRFGLGMTTSALGELEDLAGDRDAAARAYREAVALAEELHNTDDVPVFRMRLAGILARDGDAAAARTQLDLADRAAGESLEPTMAQWLAWGRAEAERRLGDPATALTMDRSGALGLPAETAAGHGQRLAIVHQLVGSALVDLGRYAEAADRLTAAATTALDSDDGPVLGMVAEAGARWALATGDAVRAGELLGVAESRRGTLHLGDPEVVATRDAVVAALGRDAARTATDRGRAAPRDAAPTPRPSDAAGQARRR